MEDPAAASRREPLALGLLAAIAFVQLFLHLITAGNYGIFRDEFYYLECADHLAWGYVDHPPFSIAVLAAVKTVLGDSVLAIRLLPALLGAVLILLAGLITTELGGGRFAQVVAAIAVLIAPHFTVMSGYYSMNAIDLVIWALAAYLLARLVATGNRRWWLLIGIVIGLGLLNKLSAVFLAAGIGGGILFTPQRRHLRQREIWIAAAIAALVVLPHVIWQVTNGWPTLEFIRNAQTYKIARLSPGDFLDSQVLDANPANVVVWVSGLVYLLASRRGRPFRLLAFLYIAPLAIFLATRSKPYYLAPAYSVLFAAGGCALEQWSARPRLRWIAPAVIVLQVAGGAIAQPLTRPFLPARDLIAYQERLGLSPSSQERHVMGRLPQHFADRFGWKEMTEVVASIYSGLPADERKECTILASNYGEAGAINYFGRSFGLPRAVSGHNNYYLWGPGQPSPRVIISVGFAREDLAPYCETVELAARIESPNAMPYEDDLPVYVARGLKFPLSAAWRRAKLFI